ncbi:MULTISPECIES: hypothetical protein [Rhizobium]|uniref:hypothetical protein n=1 Tax=Rhizobium TaxID=379 RepID=UPI000A29FE5F|nr:hypothetical protein Kim5_CH01910 [Rhizobium sp. Kim5]
MANLLCGCHEVHSYHCISHPFLATLHRQRRVAMAEVDLALLAQQSAEILEELRALRREVAELRELSGRTLDFERRNDPRRPSSLTRR